MSPQPFPNFFSGLASGLQTGQQMGLLSKQQKLEEQQMQFKIKEFDTNQALKNENRDLDRIDKTLKMIDKFSPDQRIPVLENLKEQMQTDVGKTTLDFYQSTDEATVKKSLDLIKKMKDTFAREDWDNFDIYWNMHKQLMGENNPASIAWGNMAKKVRQGKVYNYLMQYDQISNDLELGKYTDRTKANAIEAQKNLIQKIFEYPEGQIELPKMVFERNKEKFKTTLQEQKEKNMAVFTHNLQEKQSPTPAKIQGNILFKFVNGEKLNSNEKQILDKYMENGKDTYEDTKNRWQAKVDSFEQVIGRKATVDEKRRLFIADPYGMLAPVTQEKVPETAASGKEKYTIGEIYQGKTIVNIGRENGAITQLKLNDGTIVKVK